MASLLADVVDYLDRRSISAALIGAAALSRYGVARATFDADLITVSRDVLSREFWGSFSAETDVRRGDQFDPLAGVVRINRTGEKQVDVVVSKYQYVRDIIERAEPAVVAGVTLRVVRLVDLVLLKLEAGGPQDQWDIERLLANAEPALIADIDGQVAALPHEDARALWARIRAER